jgi:hypothetical protein
MYEEQQNNPSRFVEMKYKNENNKKKEKEKKSAKAISRCVRGKSPQS